MKNRTLSEQTVNEKKERKCLLPQSLYRDKSTTATYLKVTASHVKTKDVII